MVHENQPDSLKEVLRFDKYGRMLAHPDYHPNNRKAYTEEELEYLCKFCDYDDLRSMSYALGKPEMGIAMQIKKLKKEGKFEYYKRLDKYYV
jgi:hypothetical protein